MLDMIYSYFERWTIDMQSGDQEQGGLYVPAVDTTSVQQAEASQKKQHERIVEEMRQRHEEEREKELKKIESCTRTRKRVEEDPRRKKTTRSRTKDRIGREVRC
jgi:hypothetical protein